MTRFATSIAALALLTIPAQAGDFDIGLNAYAVDSVAAWASEPAIIAAIRAKNETTKTLSEADLITRDKKWRAEVGSGAGPTITPVLEAPISARLREIVEAEGGLVTEIFIMDAKGLNVGASDMTSDYWQGDEAKWQQTFGTAATEAHISEVELDESTQTYQSQISMAVRDGDELVGAITVGVNVEYLN